MQASFPVYWLMFKWNTWRNIAQYEFTIWFVVKYLFKTYESADIDQINKLKKIKKQENWWRIFFPPKIPVEYEDEAQ